MDDPVGTCRCGSPWFYLEIPEDDESSSLEPAVCINAEGDITGYAGQLVCCDCGKIWEPNARCERGLRHLRLVNQ